MKRFALLLLSVFCLYSFSCSQKETSQAPIPSIIADGPLEYVVEDLSGTVMIKGLGESEAEPAQEDQTLVEGDEIITQAGSEATLTLNETTLFHVSENTDVKVAQLFRNGTSPQSFTSQLSLVTGKILSEVEKLTESQSSFEIESGGVVCGVRGTSFEVQNQGSDIQTTTYNGAVEVKSGDNSQIVEANQRGDYSTSQGTFQTKQELTAEEKANYENWTTKLAAVRAKTHQRWEGLRALDKIPPAQKQAMLQQLSGVQGKNRLQSLAQIMRDNLNQPNSNQGHLQAEKQGSEPSSQAEERPRENLQTGQPQEQRQGTTQQHSVPSGQAVQPAQENHPAQPQSAAPAQHEGSPAKAPPVKELKK